MYIQKKKNMINAYVYILTQNDEASEIGKEVYLNYIYTVPKQKEYKTY